MNEQKNVREYYFYIFPMKWALFYFFNEPKTWGVRITGTFERFTEHLLDV